MLLFLFMLPITAFIITLVLGPGMFYFLCKTLYKKSKLRKYPLYLVDGIGDTVFIPLFNAFVAGYGLRFVNPVFSLTLAIVITLGWMTYRLFIEKTVDWSMPKHAKFNFGGWYHIVWFLAESFIIISALLEHYTNLWIWLPLIAYLITSSYSYIFQVHKWKLR